MRKTTKNSPVETMDWSKIPKFATDSLTDSANFALEMPWDDCPDFGGATINAAALDDRAAHFRTPVSRTAFDFRAKPEAYRHLARLPVEGESMHWVISGRYALWDLVPAILERSKKPIDELTIATLSFNQSNAAHMLDLLDRKKIEKLTLLISHYFRSTSQTLYDFLVPRLTERGQRVLTLRTHAKMLLIRINEARYVVESSANLRSSGNIEQFVLTRDTALYDFHHGWIHGELTAAPQPQPIEEVEK